MIHVKRLQENIQKIRLKNILNAFDSEAGHEICVSLKEIRHVTYLMHISYAYHFIRITLVPVRIFVPLCKIVLLGKSVNNGLFLYKWKLNE